MQRLERFLSEQGRYSRKEWKQLLKAGRVTVNGVKITDGSVRIDETKDEVCFDGAALTVRRRVVLLMNKPAGYVCATKDASERTVMELLPEAYRTLELRPVGRLDKETEGLLLFTDDGDLLHRLISPRHNVRKIYYAEHEGDASAEDIRAFSEGIELRDGTKCMPAELRPLETGKSEITVCEGKYHQVRRMMASRGLHVTYLKRVSEGGLKLGNLPLGAVRELTEDEISSI